MGSARPRLEHPGYGLPRRSRLTEVARVAAERIGREFGGLAADWGFGAGGIEGHARELGIVMSPAAGTFIGYHTLASLSQNGLVRACVSTPVMDMFRNWIEFARTGKREDMPAGAEGDAALEELDRAFEKFRLRQLLQSAAETAGYFGGCLVFIDTGVRGERLAGPLYLGKGGAELYQGGPLGFRVIEPADASPEVRNFTSPIDEDYLRPEWWHVQGDRIHRSRLVRVSGALPPLALRAQYNFFGIPQAQLIADYVLHFQADRLQASGLLKNVSSKVVKTDLSNVLYQGGSGEDLTRRLQLLVNAQDNNGALVLDMASEDFIKVETNLGGVTDIVRQALELVCAVNRTPVTKTLGVSPSGFNATGESDLRNYYDRVSAMQEEYLAPGLETLLRVMQLHLFGDVDMDVVFRFRPLSEEDRKLEAEVRKLRAETAAILIDRGVIAPAEERRNLVDDPESGFDDEDAEEVPPPPEPQGLAGLFGGRPADA
jgi:phage-related protein (TIGR01555 family)